MGCSQYFSNATTEKKIPNTQKSASHLKKGPIKDPLLDDFNDFNTMDQALSRLGLSNIQKLEIYGLVSAVLHLGNISFEENPTDAKGGCQITASSEKALTLTSKLMGVDPQELRQALVSRVMLSKGGGVKGTVIM